LTPVFSVLFERVLLACLAVSCLKEEEDLKKCASSSSSFRFRTHGVFSVERAGLKMVNGKD